MDKNEKKDILSAFQIDSKFMHWSGNCYAKTEFTKAVHKDELEARIIMDTYFRPNDAFLLMAVHTLSCATVDQVLLYLQLKKKRNPKLEIPVLNRDKIKQRLRFLCGQGLLLGEEYVSQKKVQVELYKCTIFGYNFFKNQLSMHLQPYDDSSVMRRGMELYKRLAVNSIGLAISAVPECKGYSFHSRQCDGFELIEKGLIYYQCKYELGNSERIYIIEPAYFSDDERYVDEGATEDKFRKRMQKLKEMIKTYKEQQYEVGVIFALEGVGGFRKFISEIRNMDTDFFVNCLYTSENVCNKGNYELNKAFMSLRFAEGGKPTVSAVLDEWTQFLV